MRSAEQGEWSLGRAATANREKSGAENARSRESAERDVAYRAFGFFLVVGFLVALLVVSAAWIIGRV